MFLSFSGFIIWKTTLNKEKKDYKVINIRKLVEFVIPATYHLLL